jgi:hypothetical protein
MLLRSFAGEDDEFVARSLLLVPTTTVSNGDVSLEIPRRQRK